MNASQTLLADNVNNALEHYNSQVDLFSREGCNRSPDEVIDTDPAKFKWCQKTLKGVKNGQTWQASDDGYRIYNYRLFGKSWLYTDAFLTWSTYQMKKIFPQANSQNRIIATTGPGSRNGFSTMMFDAAPDVNLFEAGAKCYPLYLYSGNKSNAGFFNEKHNDGISDFGQRTFQDTYGNTAIQKEDVFYYVYGMLHCKEYRSRFANNLIKKLPRIPTVNKEEDFWAFAAAGRELGDFHVGYETVEPYPVSIAEGDLRLAKIDDPVQFYRVEQMKFAGKKPNFDKATVHYNPRITMTGIPLEAYDYVVNGKPALEWVMKQQCIKTDKKSGIVNDANDYANETTNNPAYPLELFQRVITVSLETQRIVNSLPELDID